MRRDEICRFPMHMQPEFDSGAKTVSFISPRGLTKKTYIIVKLVLEQEKLEKKKK